MNYFLIGILFGLGVYLAKVAVTIIEEIVFNNLHKARWYCKLNRKDCEKKDTKCKEHKRYKNTKIGF